MFPWPLITTAFAICISILHISRKINQEQNKNKNVETLKNALLSYALLRVKKNDIDQFNFAYHTFDGSKLPPLSGCNVVHACTSYIIDKREFRKSPWYTPHMDSKLVAIDKYLDTQFDTDDKVIEFLEEFNICKTDLVICRAQNLNPN